MSLPSCLYKLFIYIWPEFIIVSHAVGLALDPTPPEWIISMSAWIVFYNFVFILR